MTTASSSSPTSVSVERLIHAAAAEIFALLNSPPGHVILDGSGTVRESLDGNPATLTLGSTFRMGMKMGLAYRMGNTVVEWEPDQLIAWRQNLGRHVWRYELTPRGNDTLVRETFDWTTARSRLFIRLIGAPARNQSAMTATLERMEAHFTSSSSR